LVAGVGRVAEEEEEVVVETGVEARRGALIRCVGALHSTEMIFSCPPLRLDDRLTQAMSDTSICAPRGGGDHHERNMYMEVEGGGRQTMLVR
jgi:hypothetical protein